MPRDLFDTPAESVRRARRTGFSRLFGWMPPHDPGTENPKAAMLKLADRFYDKEFGPQTDINLNQRLPAGYTFLAQFVAHDLSFDPSSPGQAGSDESATLNVRTPRLDLDMIYGGDPDLNPDYYELDKQKRNTYFFRFGGKSGAKLYDFPRDRGIAQIPDQRDDQHAIISQFHVALMKLHNEHLRRIVAAKPRAPANGSLAGGPAASGATGAPAGGATGAAAGTAASAAAGAAEPRATKSDFLRAQRETRWFYQYVVVNDLLPRFLGDRQVKDVLEPLKARWLERQANMADSPLRRASVPLEFTVAAFRIAHSAIRACYTINPEARNVPLFPDPADGPPADDAPTSLIGQRPLHDTHIVTWEHMLRVPGSQSRVQYARRFGPRLPAFLKHMRELKDEGGLAGRDLERGRVLGLPSGQAVARRLGIPLPPELQIGNDPLWYYVMKEVPEGGANVGPVAARILSKVFLDVLHLDPDSYLCCEPRWRPNGVSDPANSLLQLVRVAGMPFGPPDDGG